MDADAKKVLGRLQRLCAKQECCRKDVYAKALKAMGGDAVAAEGIVASLVEDGYLDDLRYATAFAREKSSLTGWGPVKIRFALTGKGMAREVVEEALSEVDSREAGRRLEALVRQKARLLGGDPQIRLKLLKFSLSRGYEYDTARPVIEEVLGGGADD